MVIDARTLNSQELFIKLKEILASQIGKDVFIEIMLNTQSETKRLKAFVSMSGCQTTDVEKKEGYYVMCIKGSPCCV